MSSANPIARETKYLGNPSLSKKEVAEVCSQTGGEVREEEVK
jgi:hypothetical protein